MAKRLTIVLTRRVSEQSNEWLTDKRCIAYAQRPSERICMTREALRTIAEPTRS